MLYTNPRGSTSYGKEFANLIHHNYPSQDYDDLISGVDNLIERGYIDENNLFVRRRSSNILLEKQIDFLQRLTGIALFCMQTILDMISNKLCRECRDSNYGSYRRKRL